MSHMTTMKLANAALIALIACTASPAQASKDGARDEKKPTWTAIVGGTVWPVSSPIIRDGVVLLKDDKIAAVGRRGDFAIPKGATTIDATGRHVTPGFVAGAARGALGVRGANLKEKAKDRFNPYADTMLMCLAVGITTAHEGPGGSMGGFPGFGGGGGAFSGSTKGTLGGVIGKLTFGSVKGFEIRDPAGIYMTYGARATQVAENRAAFEKAIEYRKKHKAWVAEVASGKKDAKVPKADDTTKAMVRVLEGELPLFIQADTQKQLRGVLELCDDYRVPMVIHGAREAWTMAPEIGKRPIDVLMHHRGNGGRATRPYRDRHKSHPHGWTIENGRILSDAGVRWGTITIAGNVVTFLFPGRDITGLTMEACFAVRGGASEQEALESITLTAARILKIDDRVGSLEVGKDADVLVMDREPLDYRSMVDLAYVNGRVAYDRSKVNLWNHIQTDRSKGFKDGWKPWGPWPEFKELPGKGSSDAGGGN